MRGRGRARRWLVGSGTVVLLAVASAGCGQGTSTDVTATGSGADPAGGLIDDPTDDRFRFTTATEVVSAGGRTPVVPPVTGVVDRRRAELRVDVSARLAPGELPEVDPRDLAVEARIDEDGLYLRAPFVAAAGDRLALLRAAGPAVGTVVPDTDRWVAVDAEALGAAPWRETAGRLAGFHALDPRVFVELAGTAAPGPAPLGPGTIAGVAVTGVRADVDHLRALRALGFPVAELTGLTEVLRGRTVPLEVWTDGGDRVRRVILGVGWAPMADAATERGAVPAGVALLATGSTTRIDVTDYGDRAIDVAAPARAVDISAGYQADRPGGGVDVLTDTWLRDLKGDLTVLHAETAHLLTLRDLQAQLDGLDGPPAGFDPGDLDGLDGFDPPGTGPPVPGYDPGAVDDLLAEGDQLVAEAEALDAETDRVLAESEQQLADTEALLAELGPPPTAPPP